MAQRLLSSQRFLHPRILSLVHVESRTLRFRRCFSKHRGLVHSGCSKSGHLTSKTMPLMCRMCTGNILDFQREVFLSRRLFYSSTNNQRKILSSGAGLNLPSVKQIEQFLSSKGIRFEHGHTSVVVACLSCSRKRASAGKDGELCMYINKTTGSHFCKNCGRSGSWRQFKAMMSEPATGDGNVVSSAEHSSSYTSPLVSSADTNAKALQLWKDSTPLDDVDDDVKKNIVEKFSTKNISKEMLEKYQVRIAEHKFSEPDGSSREHSCIAFPWYDSNKSVVHGVKLVRVDQEEDGSTVAMQPRLGVLGLFGWNTVPSDAKEVVLTLNEFDAIAVNQATSYPAISLPLGTHSLPPEVLPQLEQFERIILWFGDDVRSRQAANHFSKKLSTQRCHIVRPTFESPPTGALDALNKGLDLKELLSSSKPINHEKIATFQELRNEVYSEFVNADQVAGVKWSRFPKLNVLLKGHRRGELTIFTGPTGAGKTTLLSEMSVDLCQQGVNTLWGSFEIRNVRLAKIMMNQFSGLDLQKNVQQFNYWADKFEMLPMYFMCFYGSQNINTVIETMAHAVYVFDIDHIIIDNLQFMTSNLRAEIDRFSVQNHAISSLRSFASSKNVHVTLVIHPRKENDDVELQTASIFGTAKASQEADNVLILQDKKGKGEKYLQVTKNRFDGSVGRVPLEFVKSSLSMCGFGKKDTRFVKKTNNSNKTGDTRSQSSGFASDIDVVNVYGNQIGKAAFTTQRVKTYSPGTMKLDSRISGGGSISDSNLETEERQDVKTYSSGTVKVERRISGIVSSDSNIDTEQRLTLTDNLNASSPGPMDAGLVHPGGFEDGVRAFQGNLQDSIKSKSFKELGKVFPPTRAKSPPISTLDKVGIVGHKSTDRVSPLSKMKFTGSLNATKLRSLSSKVKNRNGMEERKVASLGRLKISTKLSSQK